MNIGEPPRDRGDGFPVSRKSVSKILPTVKLSDANEIEAQLKSRADWMKATSALTRRISQMRDTSVKTASDTASITTDFDELHREASMYLAAFDAGKTNLGANTMSLEGTGPARETYRRLWNRGHQVYGTGEVEVSTGDTRTGSDWHVGLALTGRLDEQSQLDDRMRMRILSAAWIDAADRSISGAKTKIPRLSILSTAELTGQAPNPFSLLPSGTETALPE